MEEKLQKNILWKREISVISCYCRPHILAKYERRVSEDEIKVIYIGNYEWINSTAGY